MEKKEVLLRGLKKGLSVQILSKLTGLTEKEVKAIIARHKKRGNNVVTWALTNFEK